MKESVPFVFGVKAEGETFTDRREETENLRQNLTHGVNTIIISPRRLGKTSLVDKVASLIDGDQCRVVRMDAFACRSERDFANAFATAVIRATATRVEEWIENVKSFLSHLVPKISFSPESQNEFSLSIEYDGSSESLEEVLALPERIAQKNGYAVVVCIDEFQQIGEFAESLTFQKKLRSVWQHQTNVTYCLYGSKKHMMENIFLNSSYPFYQFGDLFYLKRISSSDWIPFIQERFASSGKSISAELSAKICDCTECYSSYVQQLAWFVWLRTDVEATMEDLNFAIQRILDANESLYIQITEPLSEFQMNFLHAIADGVHDGFSRQDRIKKYRYGTSANIVRLKKSLMERDIIDYTQPNCLEISDPILKLWLKHRIWKGM